MRACVRACHLSLHGLLLVRRSSPRSNRTARTQSTTIRPLFIARTILHLAGLPFPPRGNISRVLGFFPAEQCRLRKPLATRIVRRFLIAAMASRRSYRVQGISRDIEGEIRGGGRTTFIFKPSILIAPRFFLRAGR